LSLLRRRFGAVLLVVFPLCPSLLPCRRFRAAVLNGTLAAPY